MEGRSSLAALRPISMVDFQVRGIRKVRESMPATSILVPLIRLTMAERAMACGSYALDKMSFSVQDQCSRAEISPGL
jgi:hypothetical protein